jgi:oligopeptide transport system ATP-binding protein
MKNLLFVRNLEKYFKNGRSITKAIDNVSFEVKQGEIIGLIGESGSGKTTIGRALIGLIEDVGGYVSFEDKIISGKKISKNRKKFMHRNIQMIFQDPMSSLNPQMTIYEILKEPLVINKVNKHKYDSLMNDRKQMHQNFGLTIKSVLIKKKVELLRKESSLLREIYLSIEKFKNSQEEQSQFALFNKINELYATIVSERKKFIDSSFETYENYKVLISNKSLEKDEIDYLNATNNLKNFKERERHTEKYMNLRNRVQVQEDEINNLMEETLDIKAAKEIIGGFFENMKNRSKLTSLKFFQEPSVSQRNKFLIEKLSIDSIFKTKKALGSVVVYCNNANIHGHLSKLVDITFNGVVARVDLNSELKKSSIKSLIQEVQKDPNFSSYMNIINEESQKNYKEVILILEQRQKVLDDVTSEMLKEEEHIISATEYKETLNKLNDQVKITKDVYDQELVKFVSRWKNDYKTLTSELKEELKEAKVLFHTIKFEIDILNANVNDRFKKSVEELTGFNSEHRLLIQEEDFIDYLFFVKPFSPIGALKIRTAIMKREVFKILEEVGLKGEHAYRYPHEFSGGQRQRIAIARAIITRPKLIIADEPVASLDISIQAQIINLLKDLCERRNISVVFIAHDLSVVEYIADRIYLLHLGKIVEFGETSKIFGMPVHPYTKTLFDAIPRISNSNIPFKKSNFDFTYLKEYANSSPKYVLLENDHFVLANDQQLNSWTQK